MNDVFGKTTQPAIKKIMRNNYTYVLVLVMVYETRNKNTMKSLIVLSCFIYIIINNFLCIDYLAFQFKKLSVICMDLSVCGSGLRDPVAYSLLGGGVPYPEHRLHWSLDSVPIFMFLSFPS